MMIILDGELDAADLVADGVLALIGRASPHLALLVLCVLTMVLGQFISNVATVLVVAVLLVAFAQPLRLTGFDVAIIVGIVLMPLAGITVSQMWHPRLHGDAGAGILADLQRRLMADEDALVLDQHWEQLLRSGLRSPVSSTR